MKTYNLTFTDGSPDRQIQAANFEYDGSGLKFYDEDERFVAMFGHGMVSSVTPIVE